METKISVVMTAYNSGPFIKNAIKSILNQTFREFEFIIVDDASTDQTADIIKIFKDSRIVYLRNQKNLGQTKSLNIGIRQSRGHYIARMDADDISYPQRLKLQYEFLKEHTEIAVVGSFIRIMQKGRRLKTYKFPTDPIQIKCFMAGSGDLSYWCISHPTVLMRREVLERAGFYNEQRGNAPGYPQDYDLWAKLSREYLFANIDEPLLQYRVLQNSDSRTFAEKQFKERMLITREKIKYYLPDISSEDLIALSRMLEYRPQKSPQEGKKVFNLFELYFGTYMGQLTLYKTVKKTIQQMKFHYTPQLFVTNKLLALKEILETLARYPSFLFDAKFYRKSTKVFLINIFSHRFYNHFILKKFSYR